jgi:hypothetical protein
MIRELEIESQPHELPALLGEVLQVLVQHARVEPAIEAGQVPDVDRVLDLPHRYPIYRGGPRAVPALGGFGGTSLVAGTRRSFPGKDAGSPVSF